ncbi:MAG: RnfABCDGE type electron transport complex subunit A [Solobacterium sp.]|jgi:electron transport complex protein RnfA|nr:RnfABCDGE type electron transport complex subunit A [Solobacterium sp.]MCH4205580.1 RnfABCDGE type electron transport complex subunit A [Solobacterium sp.]MCH4227085.1 RnfABCDGE type electron transport complex subunit A [Solobacterium sp.]MCH4282343.1 RnfABCDGE type electron transport complex subunit A [Solobacterium sp.]
MNLFALFISAMLINNIVLTKFLGMCPFMGVSTKLDSAVGMGAAVIFVIFGASVLSWCLYYFVLVPLQLEYMELITFILLIAAFVQFVELFLKKYSPGLYRQLGIYLPLITTNCTVLYVAQENITKNYDIFQTMVNSIATPAGFMLMLVIFATIRERLQGSSIPKPFKGNPIAFVVAGIMAIAFSSLAGLVG